jgi:hypothetical protein
MSALPPPIGWELCWPVRRNGLAVGAFDFYAQLLLSSQERDTWSRAGYELVDDGQGVEFTFEACTTLQWLVNKLSVSYPFVKGVA